MRKSASVVVIMKYMSGRGFASTHHDSHLPQFAISFADSLVLITLSIHSFVTLVTTRDPPINPLAPLWGRDAPKSGPIYVLLHLCVIDRSLFHLLQLNNKIADSH